MSDRHEHIARLVHDVGKYIARAARNVRDSPVPATVREMMIRDLYELDGQRRASEVFEELAVPLLPAHGHEAEVLTRVAALLSDVDRLEADVRGGLMHRVQEAAQLAREIEQQLRSMTVGAAAPGSREPGPSGAGS